MSAAIEDIGLGVLRVTPHRFEDGRGWFAETYSQAALAETGIAFTVAQENQSLSRITGTIRGLHYQAPPHAQAKLVRVVRGAILDVAVDIRHGSPTFGRWVSAELDAEGGVQLLIPRGFAHGFCTLRPDTEVVYLVDAPYAAASDRAVLWSDPALGIDWPVAAADAVLSAKDAAAPVLASVDTGFSHP